MCSLGVVFGFLVVFWTWWGWGDGVGLGMFYVPYDVWLKGFARELRNCSTRGEVLLWERLKGRRVMGYLFNRQKPLDCYIVDFYCKALELVIEVDGGYHLDEVVRVNDEVRQRVLEEMGLSFLRFSDERVCNDVDGVVGEIERFIVMKRKESEKVRRLAGRRRKG